MHPHIVAAPWMQYVVPAVGLALVFAIRIRRMRAARRLRLETLWILPAVYVAIVAALFYAYPPTPTGRLWCALAVVVGAAIGWYRGTMMTISVDPATHQLNQRSSPAAVILLVGLVVARRVVGYELSSAGRVALLATGIGLSLGIGLLVATRLEMTLRGKRLLRAARAARPLPTLG
jgi:membrane protein CcdC involved in cytochrome C biogenesis